MTERAERDVLTSGPLGGVRPLSATDAVRARILLAIELGLLKPGEQLPPHESTARALNVSLMTLRRVFGTLADQGILERRRGRGGGTFVSDPIDPRTWQEDDSVRGFRDRTSTVIQLIDERALIESALAAEAAGTVRDGARARALDEATQALDDAVAAGDWAEFHDADRAFHRAVASASGLDWALAEHSRIADQLYDYFVPYPIAYLRDSNDEHRRILAAIEEGDALGAARTARAHVLELKRSMFIAERPDGQGR